MKKTLGGSLVAIGLAIGLSVVAVPLGAAADDPAPSDTSAPAPVVADPPADTTPTDPPVTDPPATETPAPEVTVTPDVAVPSTYRTVAWAMPSYTGATTPTWPQTFAFESDSADAPNLAALDASLTKCGSQWQVDVYYDNATTTSLVAGGHLDGPGNPPEALVPGGWGVAYKLVHTEDCPPVFDRPVCTGDTTLPKVNTANPAGWGDLKNATFTAGGVQLTATTTDEAYAYVDFPAVKLTEMGNLLPETTTPDQVGVILQQSNGDSIHYDSDGRYWTVHPGLFPETSPGMYSTYDITGADLLSNPDVVEYALWSNPGQSALVTAAHFNCQTQPFGEDAVVVTPPTDTTQLPATPVLAETGVDSTATALGISVAVLLLIAGGSLGLVAWRRRRAE